MRILVTDADNRSALAATRSLGRAGHDVFIACDFQPSLCSESRYCSGADTYPSPVTHPLGFVGAIHEIVRRRDIELLMPMTEISTLLLTEHAVGLPSHCKLPFPDVAAVSTAADKCQVLKLAGELGVPTPRSIPISGIQEGLDAAATLGLPLVLKSGRSRVWNGKRWISTSVAYAKTQEELVEHLAKIPAEAFPVLAQERIEGPGVGVFLCCDEHGVMAAFAHRRIREKPPSGGQSVLSESTAVDPVALDQAGRLLRALHWRGVAMVEFKRDMRDGSLRLMEINGRFWGSLQLAIDAGVDFPGLLVDVVEGRRPASVPAYRQGVCLRWLWGDFDSLLAVLFKSRSTLNLPPSHPGRLRSLLNFLVPWKPRMRYEIERLDDFGPAWLELRRRLFSRGA
jgi:predicted ATP-grasp superfamily ATP-dependent carboligase